MDPAVIFIVVVHAVGGGDAADAAAAANIGMDSPHAHGHGLRDKYFVIIICGGVQDTKVESNWRYWLHARR